MFSSRLFWKLFAGTAGLNAVGAMIVGAFVSHRIGSVTSDVGELRSWLWILIAVECVCVCGLSYLVIGQVIRPVTTLNDAANSLAMGDYGPVSTCQLAMSLARWLER